MSLYDRKPLPSYYRGKPIRKISDERLRTLASPRRQGGELHRRAFNVEMGRRFFCSLGFVETRTEHGVIDA